MTRGRRLAALTLAVLALGAWTGGRDGGAERSLAAVASEGSGLLGGLLGEVLDAASPDAPGARPFVVPAPSDYAAHAAGASLSADVSLGVDLARLTAGFARAGYRSGSAADMADHGEAAGTGLHLSALDGLVPAVGSVATATSPPASGPAVTETGPIHVGPLLSASAVRGEAEARSPVTGCLFGSDLSSGLGRAVGVGLGVRAGGAGIGMVVAGPADPALAVLSSSARTALVGSGEPSRVGLLSEVRQTLAPLVFLAGTPAQFTIDFGGEWVLRAVADGRTGSVTYGPAGTRPTAVAARVIDGAGREIAALTVDDLAGGAAVVNVPGVAEISIGERPQPFAGGTAADPGPTLASATLDVARVRFLGGGAEVRVGHMEVAAAVPNGGVPCPAPEITVAGAERGLRAGTDATFEVGVTNPNDGELRELSVAVDLTSTAGVPVEVIGTEPPADVVAGSGVVWSGGEALPPGATRHLLVTVRVPPGAAAGRLTGEVRTRGRYPAAGGGEAIVLEGTGAFARDLLASEATPAPPAPAVPAPGAIPVTAPPPGAGGTGVAPPARAPSVAGAAVDAPPAPPSPVGPAPAPPPAATVPTAPAPPVGGEEEPDGHPGVAAPDARREPAQPSPAPPRPGPAGRDGDASRIPWAAAALLLALTVGVLTVRHGRSRRSAG